MKLKLNHVYLAQSGYLLLSTKREIDSNGEPCYKLNDHSNVKWGWYYTANGFLRGMPKEHPLRVVEDLGKL